MLVLAPGVCKYGNVVSAKPHILNLSLEALRSLVESWDQPAYRARQIYRQVYVNLAEGPEAMSDLPADLRKRLAEAVDWHSLERLTTLKCDDGNTHKALFALPDGSPSETVLMVYPDRSTVCVSSQSGCLMRCSFCATGKLGLKAQLTAGQIIEQVLWAERELRVMKPGEKRGDQPRLLTNVVFMGMGEAFNNYDEWWAAVERLHDPEGFNMGARSFTVSTVGLVPGIRRLAEASLPVNLAISLHAPNDEIRAAMMPINKAYPLQELLDATRDYIRKTRRRVTFEYVLLEKQNDLLEHAEELGLLLRRQYPREETMLFHVNLIPWNPVPGTPLARPHRNRVVAFQKVLEKHGVPCTVRVERGTEIAAACGQLAGVAKV